jgi:hypothetical protein
MKIWQRLPTNDRPTLSSEKAPQDDKHHNSHHIRLTIWSWVPEGAHDQDWLTDWPTVSRNVTLTEVLVVQSDANGLFHKTIHIALRFVQNGDVAEVDAMSCVDTVLRLHRLVRLIETDVSPMFLATRLNGSPCLAHVYLAHSHGIWHTPGTFKPRSSLTDLNICVLFFHGM